MTFRVSSTLKQVMGENDKTCTLMINNPSGFDIFLCNAYTENPELDGYPIPAGQSLPPFQWTGQLWIGANQQQTNGQGVDLVILRSVHERVPIK